MANRPVFTPDNDSYALIIPTEFQWHVGFARVQKQRSIESLHEAFIKENPGVNILEISSYSPDPFGVSLSAFNLKVALKGNGVVTVENVYQASKVYESGGPFCDLLYTSPKEAKLDPRHSESGRLEGFLHEGQRYSLNPATFFYTLLYIRAIEESGLGDCLMKYNAFTDIFFDPTDSINCQAYSAAIYVSLNRRNELARAIENPEYLKRVLVNVLPPGRVV